MVFWCADHQFLLLLVVQRIIVNLMGVWLLVVSDCSKCCCLECAQKMLQVNGWVDGWNKGWMGGITGGIKCTTDSEACSCQHAARHTFQQVYAVSTQVPTCASFSVLLSLMSR